MVKVWAEKEFRNLARMRQAGIRSPQPIHLRMHVLVMEFVGSDGNAAPRLKVCSLPANAQLCRRLRGLLQSFKVPLKVSVALGSHW